MEELMSAIVATIMLGSIFVCITVIVYHKISCTHRLNVYKVKSQFPRIVAVNDIELEKMLNEMIPALDNDDMLHVPNMLRAMIGDMRDKR